jgi:hypothetical protein
MTAPLDDNLQRALGDGYRVERELGGGGMSRVFVAEERSLGRKVVVKILPAELVAGLSVERFRREIQLAAQLQHPNIVPVLATGEADGLPWFTMPFVTGESLRARIARSGALPVRDAVLILRDVAAALEYAHALGIVHRDIKPDNVLLSGRAAVVTDFGIAKAISASRTVAPGGTLTQVGTSIGTPAYMAPEQAAGDPATDFRADLYAWGVTAFELLSGRLPFTGKSQHELIRAHMVEAPPGLDTVRDQLPAPLVALVAQCLAKRPEDRPASAGELLRVLESLPLSGEQSGHMSTPSVAPKRGSRVWVAAVGAVVIAVVVGVLLLRRPTTAGIADAAPPAPPAFDPALVLLVPPNAAEPALASVASLATDALSRGLGTLRYAQVTVASAAGATDRRAEATAGRMATILDGRLYAVGDSVQLDLRLTDAATGRVLRALPSIRARRSDPARGLDAALAPTLSAVAIVTNPLLGPATLPTGPLPAVAAVRALEQALAQRRFPLQIEGLSQSVALDTAWTLSRIVRAYRYLSYSQYYEDEKVRRAFVAALPGPGVPLSPYEAALREAALAVNDGVPERELAALRRLQLVAPGSFGATAYIVALEDRNRPREALAQLERVGPFTRDLEAPAGSPLAESPVHWAEVAALRHYVGEHAAERVAAERAASLGGAAIASLIRLGAVYAALGDSAAVERVVEKADLVNSEPIPNGFGGEVLLIVAQELMVHGHEGHGKQVLARALRWFERHRTEPLVGDSVPRRDIAFREALALRVAGRDTEALAIVRPMLALNLSDPRFRSFYGRAQGALGNQAAADSVDRWLQGLQQDPTKAATSLSERAFLAAARGRREDAVALLSESFARGNTFYIRRNLHRFNDWWPLREYAPFVKLVTPEG